MEKDAIQKDAPGAIDNDKLDVDVKPEVQPGDDVKDVVEDEPKDRPILERDKVMNDLVNREKERQKAEKGGDQDDDIPVSTPDAKVTPIPEPETHDDDALVELKVNGQQMFRTTKEVEDAGGVPAIQKQLSGEMKLEAAAKKQKELDQRQADLDERERKIAEKSVKPVTVTPKVDSKALADSLVLGDRVKVAGAIDTLLAAAQQPVPAEQPVATPIDPIALKDSVKADLKYEQDVKDAREDFKKDFKDIYDHPGNRIIANRETINIQKEHPDWTPSQVLTESGKRARAILRIDPAPAPEELTELEKKRLAKEKSADTIPHAHERGVKPSDKNEYIPKTQAEIFKQMEATRSR